LVSVGADEPGTFSLAANPSGLPALTSAGGTVHYNVNGNTLTGFVDVGAANGTLEAGDRQGFTFTITDTSTGAFTFTLLDQLYHPAHDDQATVPVETAFEDNLALQLASAVQFSDKDGDIITLSGDLTINVLDDIPIQTAATVSVSVDEDGLAGGGRRCARA